MIDVTCAIIEHEGKILITQRSQQMNLPGKWEFPGGKVEKQESLEACIIREIKEELNIGIEILKGLPAYEYKDQIRLIPFVCKWLDGEIRLAEHAAFLWVQPHELREQDWAEADIEIVETYLSSR